MNDVCRFSRDHVVECSERTVLACLEPVYLCWPLLFLVVLTKKPMKMGKK